MVNTFAECLDGEAMDSEPWTLEENNGSTFLLDYILISDTAQVAFRAPEVVLRGDGPAAAFSLLLPAPAPAPAPEGCGLVGGGVGRVAAQ